MIWNEGRVVMFAIYRRCRSRSCLQGMDSVVVWQCRSRKCRVPFKLERFDAVC